MHQAGTSATTLATGAQTASGVNAPVFIFLLLLVLVGLLI